MTENAGEIQGQGEITELSVYAPEIRAYRITRPSSRLHGAVGTGFPVFVERADGAVGGEPFIWVRFQNLRAEGDTTPTQGWFEPCEVEEIPEEVKES